MTTTNKKVLVPLACLTACFLTIALTGPRHTPPDKEPYDFKMVKEAYSFVNAQVTCTRASVSNYIVIGCQDISTRFLDLWYVVGDSGVLSVNDSARKRVDGRYGWTKWHPGEWKRPAALPAAGIVPPPDLDIKAAVMATKAFPLHPAQLEFADIH